MMSPSVLRVDRVYLVNLVRRADRLRDSLAEIFGSGWLEVLPEPRVFPAVDGRRLPLPHGWRGEGAGAFGCMLSHRRVLEAAILAGESTVAVIEDDIAVLPGFAERAADFLARAPGDWDCLMLGGEHLGRTLPTTQSGIVRCVKCARTHGYIVREPFLRTLYLHWMGTGGHCDHRLAELQARARFYAPNPFLIGQRESMSDISGKVEAARSWATR